ILRLEKMHILVGQDTDSESNVLEAGMPWIAKLDKDDFVGKWALEHVQGRAFREQLVGFEMTDGVVPAEGGQIVLGGRSAGRVTSARLSPQLGRAIGMAWVRPELAREDAEIEIRVNGGVASAVVRITPRRALVLCPYEQCAELRARLPGTVIDMTGALAGLELEGERALRRLTDLDLEALPAAGKVAEVPALVLRDGSRFRIFFP